MRPYRRWLLTCLLVGTAFLSLISPATAQDAKKGRKVALLIGVNEYTQRGYADKPLRFAERDVEELDVILRKAGFEVRLMTGKNSKDSNRPTKANIEKALDELLPVTAEDMVLIALAGHGEQHEVVAEDGKKKSVPFYCPRNAEKGNSKSMIDLSALIRRLNRQGGKYNLLLVDACRNDPVDDDARGVDGDGVEALPKGTAVLFSCAKGQKAYESDKAGGGHGVFFHFVLEGLRGKAMNDKKMVTWDRLVTYVKESVEESFTDLVIGVNAKKKQTPHDFHNLVGSSPVLTMGGAVSSLKQSEFINKVGMKFVKIDLDTFKMGSPETEKKRSGDWERQHRVILTKEYSMASTLVTQYQWEQVMGEAANRSKFKGKNEAEKQNMPVSNVSWQDCKEFCEKLSAMDGRKYSLPTEAEWEWACRAKTTTPFWFGETITSEQANYDGTEVYGNGPKGVYRKKPTPVTQFPANPFGLHDMHGNLQQWCADWGAPYPEADVKDPECTNDVDKRNKRVLRGGTYFDSPGQCRAASREFADPGVRSPFYGCRVVYRPN